MSCKEETSVRVICDGCGIGFHIGQPALDEKISSFTVFNNLTLAIKTIRKHGWLSEIGVEAYCPKCKENLLGEAEDPPSICTTECWDCTGLWCKRNLKRKEFYKRSER